MLFQYQRLAQPLEPSLTTPQALAWIVQHPTPPPPKRLRQSEWTFAPPPGVFVAVDNGPMAWMVQHPVAPPPARLRQSEWFTHPIEPTTYTAPPELSWKANHPDIVFRRPHQLRPDGMAPTSLDPAGFVVITVPEYICLGLTAPFRGRQHYWYTQPNPVYFAPIGAPCSLQISLANPGNCLIGLANPGDCSIGLANPGDCQIDLGVCG